MSIHFVSTAILSSSDGINHDVEQEVESSEVVKARKEAERASNKPLYQQLAEKEERRKAEYDMNTKAMMAPPKALDEEDINHLNSIQERYEAERKKQDDEETRELEKFRASRFGITPLDQSTPLTSNSSSASSLKEAEFILPVKTKKPSVSNTQSTIIVAKKRKIDKSDTNKDNIGSDVESKSKLNDDGSSSDKKRTGTSDSNSGNGNNNNNNNNNNNSDSNDGAINDNDKYDNNDNNNNDNNDDNSKRSSGLTGLGLGLGGYGSDSDDSD